MTHVDCVQFRPAAPADRAAGVRGYVTCVVDGQWRMELTLRRTRHGAWTIAFLAKVGPSGRRRFGIRPVSEEVRRGFESAIMAALPPEAFQ